MFSHHQKTVILDAPMSGCAAPAYPSIPPMSGALGHLIRLKSSLGYRNGVVQQRRVVAFVGGLDLADGRYDRPDHPLFETCGVGGPHAEDFHQACVDGESGIGCYSSWKYG